MQEECAHLLMVNDDILKMSITVLQGILPPGEVNVENYFLEKIPVTMKVYVRGYDIDRLAFVGSN